MQIGSQGDGGNLRPFSIGAKNLSVSNDSNILSGILIDDEEVLRHPLGVSGCLTLHHRLRRVYHHGQPMRRDSSLDNKKFGPRVQTSVSRFSCLR